MKTFATKEFVEEIKSRGIKVELNSNPSPETVEKIKKILEERNFRLAQLVTDYHNSEKLKI
jgi:glycine cleavage system regulatory protein